MNVYVNIKIKNVNQQNMNVYVNIKIKNVNQLILKIKNVNFYYINVIV